MKNQCSILERLEQLGISYTNKTGGYYIPDSGTVHCKRLYPKQYVLALNHGQKIVFLTGEAFLASLKETEKNFSIVLFK